MPWPDEPVDIFPAWAPDGHGFAFASNRGDGPIWWKDIDPARPIRPLTSNDRAFVDMSPTVGPGVTVYFIGRRAEHDREIYRTKAGEVPVQLTELAAEVGTPALSPTGDRLIAAVGSFDDAVAPLDTQLVIFNLNGDRLRTVKSPRLEMRMEIATDPDWVPALASVPRPSPIPALASPVPSPSPSPSGSPHPSPSP